MMTRIGRATLRLENPPAIVGYAAIGGKKEGEGPLGGAFDQVHADTTFGETTWEKAESRMQKDTVHKALDKAGLSPSDIHYVFSGDLLSQIISSNFGLREFGIPYVGLYGACSTMAESLGLAAVAVASGAAERVIAMTSSHFATAERQFRFPLEYGGQRPPTAQWTATACGCAVVAAEGRGPRIRQVTFGRMIDYGVTDQNNMGAAMAPAAADTLQAFFEDTGSGPRDFDLIVTGDLGYVGSHLLGKLLEREGILLEERHTDCGILLYDRAKQDVHAGGSGCGCSAAVLCCYLLPQLAAGKWREILFVATGALHSPVSLGQGQSIPGIAHLIHLTAGGEA